MGRHTRCPHGAHRDFARTARGLQHLPAAEIDRDVLATTGTVEDQVAALGLRRRDRPPGVVLVAGVLGDLHSHARKRVAGQARAVEADLAGVVVHAGPGPGQRAAAPRVRHAYLAAGAPDRVFDGLRAPDHAAG